MYSFLSSILFFKSWQWLVSKCLITFHVPLTTVSLHCMHNDLLFLSTIPYISVHMSWRGRVLLLPLHHSILLFYFFDSPSQGFFFGDGDLDFDRLLLGREIDLDLDLDLDRDWKYLDPFIEPDLDRLSEADRDLRRDTDLDRRGDADLDLLPRLRLRLLLREREYRLPLDLECDLDRDLASLQVDPLWPMV